MDPQFYPELTDALPWKPDGGSFLLLQSRCHGNQRINPEAIVPARVSFGMRPECENYMPKEGNVVFSCFLNMTSKIREEFLKVLVFRRIRVEVFEFLCKSFPADFEKIP
ncbi:hypothetical protein TNCV_182581 [Trichonephila clavipes]|nr:hypothetical protein TNCV_182581 [Trichonephila clavipes]